MELSDNIIYSALQRLALIHYQTILYVDFTDDRYSVLRTSKYSLDVFTSYVLSKKLSERINYFVNSSVLHEDDKEDFKNFCDIENLKKVFKENNCQSVRLIYRRKSDAESTKFHKMSLEITPFISQNGHLVAFAFFQELTDENESSSKPELLTEDQNIIKLNSKKRKKKILIIEDNLHNLEILKNTLKDDYKLIEAKNGLEGLEIIADHYREISAIILDLYMPIINGFEFLKKIKQDSILSVIPVIITTASRKDEEKCLEMGAQDFIEKPYNPQILKLRLSNIISLKERTTTLSKAEFDDLTNLFTKEAFYHHGEEALKKNNDISYCLILSTVNNLHSLTDQYGETAGRQIISHIGTKLQQYAKKNMIIARIRDGIFANLAPYNLLLEDERLLENTQKFVEGLPSNLNVATKFAVYKNIDRNLPLSIAVDRCLDALASIKNNYNQDVIFYDETVHLQQQNNTKMEESFNISIEQNAFEIWFQPKYSIKNKKINGAEALIRWRDSNGNLIPPADFIPLFERDGLIKKLDEYVFVSVCKYQSERLKKGLSVIPISINISRTSMYNEKVVPKYINIVEKFKVPKELIPIEITESAAISSTKIKSFADPFNKYGFLLHMDDFGVGFSSLSSLQILKFDTIKLDKSLIDFIGTKNGESLLRHTISYASESGLHVVAEGVEKESQFEFLKTTSCDSIQGYLFSKPLEKSEFEKLY